jgi:hypothetical protein
MENIQIDTRPLYIPSFFLKNLNNGQLARHVIRAFQPARMHEFFPAVKSRTAGAKPDFHTEAC